jgi:hypothetical protein
MEIPFTKAIVVAGSLATLTSCSTSYLRRDPAQEKLSLPNRFERRNFPSVFQAWSPAENLNQTPAGAVRPLPQIESSIETMCRHDVIWSVPEAFGLKFDQPFAGLSVALQPASIPSALRKRAQILQCNPNALILAEIRYRDAADAYLPPDSPWCKRDANNQRIVGWKEGGYFLLDFSKPEFQSQVAAQCLAAIKAGRF